jgi:putative tricarboxylic transport membrane protein
MAARSFRKQTARMAVGWATMVLSASYTATAYRLDRGSVSEPGPGIYPLVIGPLLGLAAIAVIMDARRVRPADRFELPTGVDLTRLLATLGLLAGYMFLLPVLGYLIASLLLAFVLMRVLSTRPWPWLLTYAIAFAMISYWFFVKVLQVPLPRGLLLYL